MVFFKGDRKKLLNATVIKSHNTCTNKLRSCKLFECCCTGSSKQNTKKESYVPCSLVLRSVFEAMLICNAIFNVMRIATYYSTV